MSARTLLAVLILPAWVAAQEPDIGPPPGKLYDVGGRKLHLLCSGKGSPTIVIEAGASSFAIDFTLVQREVERTNRVCAYDRAGSGWSDASTPTSQATTARDLHALLRAAGEAPPYVLVGASLGGIFVRLYHADYPDEVVGLVLIDPASEDRMFTYFEGQAVAIASLKADQLRTTIPQRDVRVPRRMPQMGAPFDRLPPELYATRIKLEQRLIASIPDMVPYETVLASAEGNRANLARLLALRKAQTHPLGDRPTIALSRGVESSPEMQEVHAGVAKLSTNWRHSVIPGAGHEIHLFEPSAVVRAIADVVESARSKTRLRPETTRVP